MQTSTTTADIAPQGATNHTQQHMNSREFAALLRKCVKGKGGSKRLDPMKVSALSEADRNRALRHIVRRRGPILVEFLTPSTDRVWLAAMGYLQSTEGASGYTFLHTSEHVIR